VQALPSLFKILTTLIFVFLFQFILQLELSLFDAYSYMNMAKTFAGLQDWLPNVPCTPFLPFLLTPIALLRYLDVTNETVFALMHLVSLGVSIGFIIVSCFLFKEVLRREFAALAAIFLVINPYSEHLFRPNLPERPQSISSLFLGVVSKSKFSLSKVYENGRVFENLHTKDRIKLTHRNGRLILEEVNTNVLLKQFVDWVKIVNPTGMSDLPEKTIFYFNRNREVGNLISKKDFDSLKEINLLNLKGSKYHFADSFVKK
jgi:hypothetical protein